jgi:hypothetical protein
MDFEDFIAEPFCKRQLRGGSLFEKPLWIFALIRKMYWRPNQTMVNYSSSASLMKVVEHCRGLSHMVIK